MNSVRFCLNHPVGVSVGVLLVLLFGLLALLAIPVQLTPNVDIPQITVNTHWQGANPQEIEREIIDRQEERLRSVKGLRKMTSQSLDNEGEITLEFYTGTDKAEALRDVNDKLRQVSGYPLEVDQPTVQAADPSFNSPIAWLVLYSNSASSTDESITYLRDFVYDDVKPYLDRVQGVASTDIFGGREREVQVRIDPGALAARGLTFKQVRDALREQNANLSAGTRTQGKRDYALRTVGQYESTEEILNTVIAYTPGGPVYVRDVVEQQAIIGPDGLAKKQYGVELSFKKQASMVRSKGRYVLALPVRREVGANVIQVMRGVREAVEKINEEVLKSRNMRIELTQVYDETVYINQSIAMVRSSALEGSLLTIIVLMAFLRNWRATLAVALAIPISVIGTFIVLYAMGRTLNVISLAGIAFAIGMVVDDAIVVLENIYRHRQMGKSVYQAVLDGASEVWAPVLASTLTTIAVFLPVIFVIEEAGQLFRDISLAVAASVALSFPVAVAVIPPLARKLLTFRGGGRQNFDAGEGHGEKRGGLGGLFASIVAWFNREPWARSGLIVTMTASSLALIPLLVPDATYLPAGNRNLVFGFLITPPGYSMDEFKYMAGVIENTVRPYWEAEPGSPQQAELDARWTKQISPMLDAGAIPEVNNPKLGALERDRNRREWLTPPPLLDNFFFVSFRGGCFMGATSRDPARVKPLTRLLNTSGQTIQGTIPFFFQSQIFDLSGGNDMEIQIRGDDLEKVTAAALALQMELMGPFGYARPTPSNFALGRPEVRIVPDRERAADLGLNVTDVGFIVAACGEGAFVGDYRAGGGRTIDISLYVKGQQNRPTQEIGQVPLYTPSGRIVPLAAAVKLIDTTAQEQINHIERQRAVTLQVSPPETIALESAVRQVRDEIVPRLRDNKRIDPSVMVSITGNADKLTAARNTMVGRWEGFSSATLQNLVSSRFFLSVLICYLLMVALYESWLYPFVIMFSVPLAIFGGFLGLAVCHWATLLTTNQPVQQLDVLTFLGFVILVGIVVKNAILLVDQSLQNMREHGMPAHEAIRESVRARTRPVLMTSMTTVFGQLPLALIPGAGSELYRGLAAVTVGGMLVSTLGTLVLVPSVLGLVMDVRAWLTGGRQEMTGSVTATADATKETLPAIPDNSATGSAEPMQALRREP